MHLPLRIARKYFFSKKVSSVVNVISAISLSGVAFGTAALIIILSVFNGFENLVISLYNSFDSEYRVMPIKGKYFDVDDDKISEIISWPGIAAVTPVIEENVLAKFDEKQTLATMKAIEPSYLRSMGIDSNNVYAGQATIESNSTPFALVGTGVAGKLELNVYSQYNLMQLYIPKSKKIVLNPARAFTKKLIRPGGVFSIQKEFDDKYILLPYSFGERLTLKAGQATAIEINVAKGADLVTLKTRVQELFGKNYQVKDRQEQHDFIHKILNSEKLAVYLILSFVLLIAAFNLVGTLTMLAIEKKKDVAILTSMGLSSSKIKRVFTYHGLLMSFTGALVGIGLGTLLCYLQMEFGLISIPGSTFVASAYPVAFNGTDHLLVLATVLAIGFLASWLPSITIGKKVDLRELQVR